MKTTIIKRGILVFLAAAALLCAGCNSPFKLSDTPPAKPPALAHVTLIITGLNDRSPARTLFPETPVFTSVRLTFAGTGVDGVTLLTKNPMEIPLEDLSGPTAVVDFDVPGKWIITVYGQVTIGVEKKEVAKGSSEEIDISDGGDITAAITLTSIPPDTAETGTFEWKIAVPQTLAVVDAYSLTLSAYDNDSNMPVNLTGSIPDSYPVEEIDSVDCIVIGGTQDIPEGYYFLQASVGNADQKAYYVDVVHILAHRTTRFEHTVDPDEFVPILTLSGTAAVTAKIDGGSSPFVINEIRVYSDDAPTVPIASTTVAGDTTWEMVINQRETATDMFFTVIGTLLTGTPQKQEFEVRHTPTVAVTDTNLPGIAVTYFLDAITLTGAVQPYGYDSISKSDWEVRPYIDLSDWANSYIVRAPAITDGDGNWSMLIEKFGGEKTIYFTIQKEEGSIRYERVAMGTTTIPAGQTGALAVPTIVGYFAAPMQVNITSDLPGLGIPKKLIPSSDYKKFTYTVTGLSSSTLYTVNLSAYFTQVAIDGNTVDHVYGYDRIVETACSISADNIDFAGNATQVTFTSPAAADFKTLKITLDFGSDDYLHSGTPHLTIETRHEVPIYGGTFNMGSPTDEKGRFGANGIDIGGVANTSDEEQHQVTLSRDYYMMPTEVTQGLYEELMPIPGYGGVTGLDYPVVNISWFDAVEFANELSKREGLPPVYTITGAGNARSVTVDWDAAGWRLPTEAEWEYAARASASSVTPFAALYGTTGTTLNTNIANYNGSTSDTANFGYNPVPGTSRNQIVEVKLSSFFPNAWGLYNMHGNVWEYCWDWYDADYYTADPVTDPLGPDAADPDPETNNANSERVIRGGGYSSLAWQLRSAKREKLSPLEGLSRDYVGFRLVRLQN